jgi:hypothetical protein
MCNKVNKLNMQYPDQHHINNVCTIGGSIKEKKFSSGDL